MRVPRILSGIKGRRRDGCVNQGDGVDFIIRETIESQWRTFDAVFRNLEQKKRRNFRFDLWFHGINFLYSTKKNLLERIHGIERAKKLIFFGLSRPKNLEIKRGFESIIDNNGINLCVAAVLFFFFI